MANASNAYATIDPIKTNIGDVVQGIEQMDFAYREEQRKIDAIKQAQKEKEAEKLEKLRAKFKPINIDSTGVKSIDEVNAQTLLKAVNMYGELDKKLAQAQTPEEQAAITIQLQKLQSLPDYLKLAQDAFVTQAKDIQTKIANGEIKQTPELLSKLQSFSQGFFEVELDDNMTPMIGLWDKDGDGKPDVLPYDKIVSGQTFGELIPNVDFSGNFMTIGTKVGTVKNQTDQNFVKNTKLYTPDELNKTAAKAELYLENGQLSPVAKSYLYDKGVRDFQNVPDELLDKMEQDAISIMKTVQKKEDITDKDYSAETGRISENRQAKKDKEEKQIVTTTVNLNDTKFGSDNFPNKKFSKKGILGTGLNLGKGIDFKTIGGASTGLDNSTITNIFVNDKNQIIYTVDILKSKGGKSSGSNDYSTVGDNTSTTPSEYAYDVRTASATTEAKIASELGYNNADELKAELKKLNNDTSKQKIDY